jgi:hypothetical protein
MVTRLYWHNTSNGTTGLPTTKQSAQSTAAGNAIATTSNKNMTTTIGTSQTSISYTPPSNSGYAYFGRWVSDVISQTSIAANTWTFSFGYDSFWGTSDTGVAICIYVWRPTTTTKIATIMDTTNAQQFNTTERGYILTATGSAVASGITSGTDVLCVEIMTNTSLSGGTLNLYYDGTTAVATNNTAASSVASYIETPENLSLGAGGGGGGAVTATPTSKVVTNKFIAHG